MNAANLRSLCVTRHFDASAESVFDAWLDPATVGHWLFATDTGVMVRVDIDARVGGRFVLTDRRGSEDVEHVGEYLVLDRPHRLVFRFTVPKYSPLSTRVTIDLASVDGGCELVLTHEGVLPEWAEATRRGWGDILARLAGNLHR